MSKQKRIKYGIKQLKAQGLNYQQIGIEISKFKGTVTKRWPGKKKVVTSEIDELKPLTFWQTFFRRMKLILGALASKLGLNSLNRNLGTHNLA